MIVSKERTFGSRLRSIFIVDEEKAPTPDLVEEDLLPHEPKPPTSLPLLEGPTSPVAVNFAEVFSAADIGEIEQGCMEKASELLHSLPAETPIAIKRQIVEASLRVFGFPIESIIKAGMAERVALDSFLEIGQDAVQKLITESKTHIERLQADIAGLQTLVEGRLREHEGQRKTCEAKKIEIQMVLEFFGKSSVPVPAKEEPEPPKEEGA